MRLVVAALLLLASCGDETPALEDVQACGLSERECLVSCEDVCTYIGNEEECETVNWGFGPERGDCWWVNVEIVDSGCLQNCREDCRETYACDNS